MTHTIKAWLDKLFFELGNQQDFGLGVGSQSETGERVFWRNVKKQVGNLKVGTPITYMLVAENFDNPYFKFFLSKVNQRQILPCEVILDIEEKDKLQEILNKLQPFNLPYYVFSTGSRGYHIHMFFDQELSDKDKLAIIKYFGTDEQLVSKNHFIALEFAPHWKSGKIKELVSGECENANLV